MYTFLVISTYNEPVPGWVSNYAGINGVSIAAALGILRVLWTKHIKLAMVPSDKVANIIVSSAWYTGITGYWF